eukprot:TRINITY_DN10498_c0_g2_i2.p2 TRINITY_DN10498_c0_g2~~TRINITY_DN10498_c0_g2_i2.p2  ORF type:complete len:142 (-),score=41.95 TRINITY_DN10498_c0_g2_i2:51-476(-)
MEIPADFGYVVLVVGLSWVMNIFLIVQVAQARKRYNVQYPNLYAPAGHKNAAAFDSVQRAHQNTLENFAPLQLLMVLSGLVFPRQAASFGLLWVVARVIYGAGYAWAGPRGRMAGAILSQLAQLPLLGLTFWAGARIAGLL